MIYYISNDIFGFAVSPGLTKILPIEKCIFFWDTMYYHHKKCSLRRYCANNLQQTSFHKKYSCDIPKFLNERPKLFVVHCKDRMPPRKVIHVENITRINQFEFKVKGDSACLDHIYATLYVLDHIISSINPNGVVWNEMKWWCFRPLLCTLFRLIWAKQTPGIMRRN